MKNRVIILFLVLLLVFPLISADVILKQQPNEIYNLGDVVNFPLKIVSTTDINSFLSIDLLCNGVESMVHKEFISLKSGEEKTLTPQVPLISSFINRSGVCKGKISLGNDYLLSNQFKVSDKIIIKLENYSTEFFPEQEVIFQGEADTEAGNLVENGFIEINLSVDNSSDQIKLFDTIENGLFYVNYTLPKNIKAGDYKGNLLIYQKDINGIKINKGKKKIHFFIKQIPTELKLLLEKNQINPTEKLRIKPILYDQSGDEIKNGKVVLTIKDSGKILRQSEGDLGTFFEYEFNSTYPPSKKGSVFAISSGLSTETEFEVLAFKKVSVEIINNTILLKNQGNIPYNDTVLIQIGEKTLKLNTSLDIGESKKYILSAPNGEYEVKISAGDNQQIKNIALTGDAISVREFTNFSGVSLIKKIFIWLFIIIILGFFAYFAFREFKNQDSFLRRRSKKNIIVRSLSKKSKEDSKIKTFIVNKQKLKEEDSANLFITSKNKGVISSSIAGEKQKSSLICLNLKNFKELKEIPQKDSGKESVKNVLNKIVNLAETNKAFTYVSDNFIFFIFAPSLTKTFDNEKFAIKISNKMSEFLDYHNKLFKDKIKYGFSLNTGEIILNKVDNVIKFMPIGSLIIDAKKISNFALNEIVISKNMNEKIISYAKTDKKIVSDGKIEFYKIREMRDKERHKKFLGEFIKRMESDKEKS